MTCLGFKKSVIKWSESYLQNRKFFAFADDIFSQSGLLNCGDSQRCILGPLLFSIYINDLPQSLSENGSYLFVYDTKTFLNKEFLVLCK